MIIKAYILTPDCSTCQMKFKISKPYVQNPKILEWNKVELDHMISYCNKSLRQPKTDVDLVKEIVSLYKGLESDPSKSPPAQQHFATVLDFQWIQKPFLL